MPAQEQGAVLEPLVTAAAATGDDHEVRLQAARELVAAQGARLAELNRLQRQRAAAAAASAASNASNDFWRVEGGAGVGDDGGALAADGERLVMRNAASKGKAHAQDLERRL